MPIFSLQVYFLPFYERNYNDYVSGSEHRQNTDDLRSVLFLNASCVDTDGTEAAALLMRCSCHASRVDVSTQRKKELFAASALAC